MKLRWYQEEALDAVWQYFCTKAGNPIIAMPTGTGKSLVIAEFIRRMMQYPGQRVMMLTHVKELIVQNMQELLAVWPTAPAGIYSAGVGRKDYHCPITFAGIGSVANKANLFGHIDIVFIDEAHLVSHSSTTMYRKFLAKLKKVNPSVKVIGLTATKYRLGLGMLTEGGLFTDVCYDITTMESFNRLVAEGYLAPLIPKRTTMQYSTDGISRVGGEFNQKELQAAVDVDQLTYAAVRETIELGYDRKHWLIFASGVEHCEHVAAAFDSFNIPVTFIHSNLTGEERDRRLLDFARGKYRAMVNNSILTTGYNFKPLDLISVMAPTESTSRWVQMLGRGTRPSPETGKTNCLVLDFAKNTQRLGPINDPCIPKKKGKGGGTAPVKICPACNTYNHASVRECVNCHYEFPKELKIDISASSIEVMKDGLPVVEEFKVSRVVYNIHHKENKPSTLRVTYYCGLRLFTEHVCLEHVGFASKRARDWWRARSDIEPPETVTEAMHHINDLEEPLKIAVWLNTKYPEIVRHDF